jgi:crotonobetainyl-CoA:carnitine CoA-transferase CaiB-like acyl-CoA transferase
MDEFHARTASVGPLAGITVIELGHSVAAPYAGLILADLGARVIKVENPASGDYARGWGPPFWQDTASLFAALNRGKEGITVDFTAAGDLERLRHLIVNEADAVIQNLRPGLLERVQLDAASMHAVKSSLIWCDIGAFGATGPLARKPGYDPLVQASSGIMSVTGEGGRPPVRVGVSLVDMGSGMWTVIGLLTALLTRARGEAGPGRVATSLYETGLAWMTIPLAGYAAGGNVPEPHGSGTGEIVPYQAFQLRDAWVMIAAGNDNLFAKLCGVLGRQDLPADDAYRTNKARVHNRSVLVPLLEALLAKQDSAPFCSALDAVGVPNAPLLSVDQVAGHEQTKALQMAIPRDGDGFATMGIPLTFNGVRFASHRPAPKLGEHNPQIDAANIPT